MSLDANVATRGEKMIRLSGREAEVLSLLNEAYPRFVSRVEMYEAVYGHYSKPQTVYNVLAGIIHTLRRKLGLLNAQVICKYQSGYRLVLS